MTIETIWEDHQRFNQPTKDYLKLQDHFQINLDETSVLGSTGIQKWLAPPKSKCRRRIHKTIMTPLQLFELGMQQEIPGLGSSSSVC